VVPAEDERQPTLVMRILDQLRDARAGGQDVAQKANALVAHLRRLRDGGLNVPEVDAFPSELFDPGGKTLVADRRGPHVHATATGPEIEGGADHGDGA
jgi:hypothetical protein